MSISRQCRLLSVSRRTAYRSRREAPGKDLAMMRRINELHTAHPFYGTRQLVVALRLAA